MSWLDDLINQVIGVKAKHFPQVNLIPGDVTKKLTGTSAQAMYEIPTSHVTTFPPGSSPASAQGGGQTYQAPAPAASSGGGDVGGDIYQSALDIIGRRLEEVKALAAGKRERAGVLKEGALGDIRDTTSMIRGGARRTAGDIETKQRMRARAMNRQGSSAYDQAQISGDNTLARSLGGINLDAAGGRRSVFDRYAESMDAADELESAGVMDFGLDTGSAFAQMQAKLEAIDQANRMIAAITGQYTGQGATDKSTSLLAALNQLPSFSMGQTAPTTQGGSMTSPTDYLSLLEEQRKRRALA